MLEYEGEPLVARAAAAAHDAGAAKVAVVTGAFPEEVQAAVSHLAFVTIVFNPDWSDGIASSLRAGLNWLSQKEFDGVLVTLCDQPRVNSRMLQQLVDQFDSTHRLVAAAYGGTTGVPALFGHEFVSRLIQLQGDEGAGKWLREHQSIVTAVPMDEAAADVDTAADAEQYQPSSLRAWYNQP